MVESSLKFKQPLKDLSERVMIQDFTRYLYAMSMGLESQAVIEHLIDSGMSYAQIEFFTRQATHILKLLKQN